MALLASELQRLRFELGFNTLAVGAEPYISVYAVFDQVIAPYLLAGASTTSSTVVTAASEPTPVTLTLASATGFAAGARVVVDVDSRQESATVQAVTGSTITLMLTKAHTGTFSVSVEGGEAIIRGILQKLDAISGLMGGGTSGLMAGAASSAGLRKVDEIEFFGGGNTIGTQGVDQLTQLVKLQEYWRDELAYALGIPRLNKSSGGGNIGVY